MVVYWGKLSTVLGIQSFGYTKVLIDSVGLKLNLACLFNASSITEVQFEEL